MIQALIDSTPSAISPVKHTYIGVTDPDGKRIVVAVHDKMLVTVTVEAEDLGYTDVMCLIERSHTLALEAYELRLRQKEITCSKV